VASGCLAGCPYRVSSNRRRSSQLKLVWSLSWSWRDLQGVWRAHRPQAGDAFSQIWAGSGSFGLSHSLLGLACYQDGLRGFPGPCRRTHSRRMVVQYLHGLGSPTKCVYLRWIRKSSSLGIHPKVCSSTVSPMRVLSWEASFPSAWTCHGPGMGRPRGFAPPRRFTPRKGLRVYCAPLPVLEFATFQHHDGLVDAEATARSGMTIPATRFTPLEEFPSLAAVLHHCSRCPLAVTVHFTPREAPRCFTRPDACSEERGKTSAEALALPQLCGAPSWQARVEFPSR
jgi:hypothetical protein